MLLSGIFPNWIQTMRDTVTFLKEAVGESFGHWTLAEALGGQGLGRPPRRPWTGTQTAAFGEGCRTGLESGAHPGAARRAVERAHDGSPNRAEQIERATALGGP
jgi:hypothetical protein